MAEGGLSAATPSGAVATATPDLAQQAAKIQEAISRLQPTTSMVDDPMMLLQFAAGMGGPTKTGSFFESLGSASKNASDYAMANRAANLQGLAAQAQLLGMQADLPLKQMQAEQVRRQMEGQSDISKLISGATGGVGGGAIAATKGAMKAAPGVVASPSFGGSAVTEIGAPAIPQPEEGPKNPAVEVYNSVKLPDAVATQTERFNVSLAESGVRPAYDLGKLYATSDTLRMIGIAKGVPGASEAADKMRAQADGYIKEGYMPGINSSGELVKIPIPGHLKSIYDQEFAKSQAGLPADLSKIGATGAESRKTAAAQQQLDIGKEVALTGVKAQQESEREVAKDLAKTYETIRAEAESARRAQVALDAMKEVHPKAIFGNGADEKLWVAKLGQEVGIGNKDRVTASEIFDKNAAVLADELGSRGSGTDAKLANAMKANPSRNLSPEGAQQLIEAAALRNQRLLDKEAAAESWLKSRGSMLGFAQAFEKSNPLSQYESKHDWVKAGAKRSPGAGFVIQGGN